MTRITPTTPMKQRTSANIRRLAAEVAQTFPDMSLHDHLADAARELDGGRIDGSKRHLNAAIEGFAPLQLTRHGIHDDEGHRSAKHYMQQAYRHLLNVRDIEDVRQRNEGMMEQRRAMAAASGKTFLPSSQPVPVGAPNGAPGPVAVAPVVSPQSQGLKPLSWEDIDGAIDLATFAGAKPGSGKNFAKLSASLAKRGARNPAALAAYIGRKKYGRKGFAKLGQKHSNSGSAVELVGPHGYTHNWVYHGRPGAAPEERANELSHYLAHNKLKGEDRHQAHLEAARRHHFASGLSSSPDVSARHEKLARFHEKVAQQAKEAAAPSRPSPDFDIGSFIRTLPIGARGAPSFKVTQMIAAGTAGPRPAGSMTQAQAKARLATIQASWDDVLDAIELVGPKGYSHGWKYHGPPTTRTAMIDHLAHGHGQGLPTGRTGFQQETRTFEDFQKVHENMHRMNPSQNHTHEPPRMASARVSGRRASSPQQEIRDFEALASMPGFTPEQNKMLGIAEPDWYKKIAAPIRATIQASWEDIDRAILLSAETGRLATEHHPFGKPGGPGLWGVKGMELPPYIQNIARALLRTGRAKTLSQAIAIARGASKRWAAGGGNVRPEVRAASAGASADWSAKQARAHAHANDVTGITLAGFNPAEPRTPVGTWGGEGTVAASGLSKQQLQQRVKADRARLKVLNAQLARLTTIKHKTTASAQKAAATGKTAAATPAKHVTPAKKGPAGKKAPTRGQLITALRTQIKQLTVQIAADQKRIAALSNPLDGILLAS